MLDHIYFASPYVHYFIVILSLGILVSLLIHFTLRRLESRRRKRLKNQDTYDVTPAEFEQSVDDNKVKEQHLREIGSRFNTFRTLAYIAIWFLIVLLIVLPTIHKHSPVLSSLLLAALSVVIGIAAKPFVENIICGAVLAFGKLARIGDTVVVDGEYGIIERVTLTHCVVKRWDWLRYVIPNSMMMTKEFVNYSLYDNFRWVYVEFWIDYSADLKLVETIAKKSPSKSSYCSDDEDTRFWVVEMDKDSVKCMVVAWATSPSDGWMLSIDIRNELMRQFQEHKIAIHTLHVVGSDKYPGGVKGVCP